MSIKPKLFYDKNNNKYEIVHSERNYETHEEYVVFRNVNQAEDIIVTTSKKFFGEMNNSCDEIDVDNSIKNYMPNLDSAIENEALTSKVNQKSHSSEKVKLFMSLFKGREDVYAKRWESKDGRTGYVPACSNEWIKWVCEKPRIKCTVCNHRKYVEVSTTIIQDHLLGKSVVGLYPMLQDETCHFLVMDFDKEDWQQNVGVVREICDEIGLKPSVERSGSGNGAHI